MDHSMSLSTRQRLFVVSSVVLGTMLLSAAVLSLGSGPRRQEMNLPTVQDRTEAFQVLSLEKISRRYLIRARNTSGKVITAYVMAVCDEPESSADYTIGDHPIQPEAVVEINTPVQAVGNMCSTKGTPPTITILAVVFEDRTTAGEFSWAKGILDDRRGNKIQLKRINRLLRAAQKWPDADQPAAIERLKAEVEALPLDEAETPTVRSGQSDAKQRTLYLLDQLKQWHQNSLNAGSDGDFHIQAELDGIRNLKEGLDKLIRLHEKWISRE